MTSADQGWLVVGFALALLYVNTRFRVGSRWARHGDKWRRFWLYVLLAGVAILAGVVVDVLVRKVG